MKGKEETEKTELEIRVRIPKELEEGRYSNYAVVSHSPHEFHIFFAQISPREPSDKIADADAVTHVIIAPSVIPKVIEALSKNYERYKKRRGGGD